MTCIQYCKHNIWYMHSLSILVIWNFSLNLRVTLIFCDYVDDYVVNSIVKFHMSDLWNLRTVVLYLVVSARRCTCIFESNSVLQIKTTLSATDKIFENTNALFTICQERNLKEIRLLLILQRMSITYGIRWSLAERLIFWSLLLCWCS